MIETYYVGAYWGPRRESVDQCAQRAHTLLHHLEPLDESFARWFPPTRSHRHAPQPISRDVGALQALFSQGRTQNDEGAVIEDLGFHISLDNGMWPGSRQREFAWLRFKAGSYADHVPNTCLLSPPSAGEPRERLVQASLFANILRAMVLAWEPERCIATSHAHRELVSERGTVGTFVGWIMYFPDKLGPLPPLPHPVQVEHVKDRGSLLILTPERFTASNPEHVALAARVRETLSQAGLMKPLSLRAPPASSSPQ